MKAKARFHAKRGSTLNKRLVDERLLDTAQAAEILMVSAFTVRNWARTGKLPAIKLGGRRGAWRFLKSELYDWLRRQQRGGEITED